MAAYNLKGKYMSEAFIYTKNISEVLHGMINNKQSITNFIKNVDEGKIISSANLNINLALPTVHAEGAWYEGGTVPSSIKIYKEFDYNEDTYEMLNTGKYFVEYNGVKYKLDDIHVETLTNAYADILSAINVKIMDTVDNIRAEVNSVLDSVEK